MKNISKVKQTIQTFWKIYKDNDDPDKFKADCIAAMGDHPDDFTVDICHAFQHQMQLDWEEDNGKTD